MTEVIDREERHKSASIAIRIAKGASVLLGICLAATGVVALVGGSVPTLGEKVFVACALVASLVCLFTNMCRADIANRKVRRRLEDGFRGTTWLSIIDGKPAKGAFIGATEDLRSMRLSLANGAVAEIRIDHAIPVGHEKRSTGQFWSMSRYEAGLVAGERRNVVTQLRVGAATVGIGSFITALGLGSQLPWSILPLLIIASSSLLAFLAADYEKHDFEKDTAFLSKQDDLTAAAASETPLTTDVSDPTLQDDVYRRANSPLRTTVVGVSMLCGVGGLGMAVLGGLLPLWQYMHDDMAFKLHKTAVAAVAPEHAAIWLFTGFTLAGLSCAVRFGYDVKFLLPTSYFNRHRWVSAGGAAGKVVEVQQGGSYLTLRFEDDSVGNYPIKYLRRGELITA